MLNQHLVPIKYHPLYLKKYKNFTMCFNSFSTKSFVLLNKKNNMLFNNIDGRKQIKDYFALSRKLKLNLTKEQIINFFNHLYIHDIVNYEGNTRFHFIDQNKKYSSLSLWINLTNQCNFRCDYCYVDKKIKRDMASISITNLVKKLKKYDNYQKILLILAGGEPLLKYPLIKELISEIKKQKTNRFELAVLTNGLLLTDSVAKFFYKNNVYLCISLDGLGQYNDLNRKLIDGSGTYKYIQRAIEIAKKNHILDAISITVSSKNIEGLPSLTKFCLKNNIKMEIHFFHKNNNLCNDDLRNEEKKMIFYLKKTLTLIYAYYEKNKLSSSPVMDQIIRADFKSLMGWSVNNCDAGSNFFSITPEGTVEFCPFSGMDLASVDSKDMISKARETAIPFLEKMSVENIKECQNCYWKYICAGGCIQERLYFNKQKPTPKCRLNKLLIPILLDFEAKRIIKNRILSIKNE